MDIDQERIIERTLYLLIIKVTASCSCMIAFTFVFHDNSELISKRKCYFQIQAEVKKFVEFSILVWVATNKACDNSNCDPRVTRKQLISQLWI